MANVNLSTERATAERSQNRKENSRKN